MIIHFNIRRWQEPSNDAVTVRVFNVSRRDQQPFDYGDFEHALIVARAHLEDKKPPMQILPVDGGDIINFMSKERGWRFDSVRPEHYMNI